MTKLQPGFVALSLAAILATGCNSLFGIDEGTLRPMCVDPGGMLIDDMEDGEASICQLNGRNGVWYAVGDGTGTDLTPGADFKPTLIPAGRGTSRYAARLTGSGFTDWGALMGFNLKVENLATNVLDVSAATGGIRFWMKSNTAISVDFLTPQTTQSKYGGLCDANATDPNCNSHFSFPIITPSGDWVEYQVPFVALTQKNGGSLTWSPRVVLGIQFVALGPTFDVWIDDISFYTCNDTDCLRPTCTDPSFPVACPPDGRFPAACRPPGTECAAVSTWCADPLLIDDMEDGDSAICDSGSRDGRWSVYGDGSSTDLTPPPDRTFVQTSIPGGRGTSRYAAHLHGSGFGDFGAGMGFNLLGVGPTAPGPYDASQSAGIKFWMKNDVPVSVGLSVPDTIPIDQPFGTCDDGGVFQNCYNDFVFEVRPSGNEWIERTIPFAALEQRAFLHDSGFNLVAGSARWEPAHLLGIEFAAHYSAFDVWVDDLRFYACQADCLPTCSVEEPVACPASGGLPAGCWPEGTDCSKPRERIRNTAVWGSGAGDVWVVGYSRTTLRGSLRHWKDSGWVPTTGVTAPPVWGVWGSSADNVWAVADHGTVLFWNGSDWSSAAGAATTSTFNGVWGAGASDVWAIESPDRMLHRIDTAWVPTTTMGTSDRILGVRGTDPNHVWAVGDHGTIRFWNGSVWTATTSGTAPLAAAWGRSPEDVWAVGGAGTILHLTGSGWSAAPSPTAQFLRGVWGSASNDVWAVGEVGTIVHWDGSKWSAVPSGTTRRLLGVWGSGSNDVWAVGLEIILRWNGQTWSVQP